MFERFLDATRNGDLTELEQLLADDVAAYNDGGGNVRAAPKRIVGLSNVLRFIAGLLSKYPLGREIRVVEANGLPDALLLMGDPWQLVALDVRCGKIHEIYAILNPDKLSYAMGQLG